MGEGQSEEKSKLAVVLKRNTSMGKYIALAAIYLCLISPLAAQDAVPGEMLTRTMLINNGKKYGTAFKTDYQGRIYLVTARHMVEGMPTAGERNTAG
jgi:hypothetical protein